MKRKRKKIDQQSESPHLQWATKVAETIEQARVLVWVATWMENRDFQEEFFDGSQVAFKIPYAEVVSEIGLDGQTLADALNALIRQHLIELIQYKNECLWFGPLNESFIWRCIGAKRPKSKSTRHRDTIAPWVATS